MSARLTLWTVALLSSACAAFTYGQLTTSFDASPEWRVPLAFVMGVCGFAAVFLFPDFKRTKSVVFAIWIPAILLRALLLPAAPSDDVNRYLWEGHLLRAGEVPYAHTADSTEWKHFRDDYWSAMNHKDKRTAYPPITEIAFAAIGGVVYHPIAYKVAFLIADLLTLSAILRLLRRRGLSLAYSGLYALSPVVLLSYAGEAHFDSLMIAALLWAVVAFESGRERLAVALAAIATGIKWVTLPLLPFFGGRALIRNGLIAVATLVLPALFFWQTLLELLQGLLSFGGTRSFNGPVYDLLLLWLGLSRDLSSMVVMALFASICVWRWFSRKDYSLDSHARWILGGLIVLSPTVHFWYLAWILPFVCLRPSMPWVCLSLSSCVYFSVWSNDYWGLTVGQRWFFWMPFLVALIYEVWSTKGRVLFARPRFESGSCTVAIVIPTKNAGDDLPLALLSVEQQSDLVDEVIVVDADSDDETVRLATEFDSVSQVVQSTLGRGNQIAAGIEAASADWVLVLHADARLAPDSVERVRAISRDRSVLGGSLGQRFAGSGRQLLFIELLNDLRALFTRTAFGDQVQFFHRETALQQSLMPVQPLMEDVESSWRLREAGGFVHLGCHCQVSRIKWQPQDWLKRIRMVLGLMGRYRWARMRGNNHAEVLSAELYQEYYKTGK